MNQSERTFLDVMLTAFMENDRSIRPLSTEEVITNVLKERGVKGLVVDALREYGMFAVVNALGRVALEEEKANMEGLSQSPNGIGDRGPLGQMNTHLVAVALDKTLSEMEETVR